MDVERSNVTIDEWEGLFGDQIRRLRLSRNIDQARLAELADVSIGAISNLERGNGSSLKTVVAVLRALDRTDWLESLAPAVTVSPMQMLRAKQRGPQHRMRASRSRQPEAER